ncbi:MAG: S1C family serine protease [Firmicutes bacterium]|nr:S1C family serine protease [Bacillota bacterium]
MKKLTFLIILLSFLLSGCTFFVVEEDSEEYVALSNQYDNYILSDINQLENFQSFINGVTLSSSLASVMIEVKVYSSLGLLLETRYGSGVIFHEDSANYHILTTFELTNVDDRQTISIEISDYLGRTYRAFTRRDSSELGLSGIRVAKNSQRILGVLAIADYPPLVGQPVMLIGYQRRIINALTMGMIIEVNHNEDNELINLKTTVLSDNFGNGGVMIDMNHEIIGIQYEVENGFTYAHGLDVIQAFHTYYLAP